MSFSSIRRSLLAAGCALAFCTGTAFAATAPRVQFETSMGNITIELDQEKAPKTVANFLKYVEDKQYDETIFHRVIDGFMIQGGGFTRDMAEKPTREPIQNEAANGLKNLRGTIAMARKGDPHSATAQFFINVVDNAALDYPSRDGWGYAVFGKVVEGMDVVDKIKATPTRNLGPFQNVPVTPIIVKHAQILAAQPEASASAPAASAPAAAHGKKKKK